MPPKIKNLISTLGLRYAPSAKDDMQAHAARIALLAEDMAEARPDILEEAISRWVGFKPYLPKASELIAIMTAILEKRQAAPQREDLQDQVARLNALPFAAMLNRRYFLNYRMEDGEKSWFIDHREDRDYHDKPVWKPASGEMEEIHSKVAKYVAQGWTQHEFNQHVRRTKGNI